MTRGIRPVDVAGGVIRAGRSGYCGGRASAVRGASAQEKSEQCISREIAGIGSLPDFYYIKAEVCMEILGARSNHHSSLGTTSAIALQD